MNIFKSALATTCALITTATPVAALTPEDIGYIGLTALAIRCASSLAKQAIQNRMTDGDKKNKYLRIANTIETLTLGVGIVCTGVSVIQQLAQISDNLTNLKSLDQLKNLEQLNKLSQLEELKQLGQLKQPALELVTTSNIPSTSSKQIILTNPDCYCNETH